MCARVQICSYMPDFVYVCIFCVLYFAYLFRYAFHKLSEHIFILVRSYQMFLILAREFLIGEVMKTETEKRERVGKGETNDRLGQT